MRYERRQFLETTARLVALSALAAAFPGTAIARTSWYPFHLGVASGSPRPTSVILWTRLVAEPLAREPVGPSAVAVRWEVSEDEGFRRIAASGTATALPALAHSVHVEVEGLKPDHWYWYRFMVGDATSLVARTRTAPAPDALPDALRFAFASCQHWEFGQYAAHRHIAAASPDLIVFLGDYIYEWGPYELAHPTSARRTNESFTLADYRARYAQYKSDPHLQQAHRVAPWIVAWDDHEVANDYGADRDERLDQNFLARRGAAYQAFYEHMPVRLYPLPAGSNRFAHMRSHDRFDWGRLARFNVLDDRQYRSYHACPKPGRGGSNSVTRACAERVDPSRTMLGFEQEAWLAEGFAASPARWNFIAQQTLMAQNSQVPVLQPGDGQFWTDGWDGYPAARQRLLADLVKHRTANPIVISGDVHTFFAADLLGDFYRPRGTGNPVIATEFCGTSVTSPSRPQARTAEYVAQNPHLKYGRSDKRGYVMMEVTPKRTTASFESVDDVTRADSGMTTVARFDIIDGVPGIGRT
jgi:alkaline phosphatase D